MSRVTWRWEEKDFGFRFRTGKGRSLTEHYQARNPTEYYVIPSSQRKLAKKDVDRLDGQVDVPASPQIVANPWRNYERDWDWVECVEGICLNFAGCLDKEEIDRREDEGVQRAMELVARFVERDEPSPVSLQTVRQIHVELMGVIYPFAGNWRTVSLHKGEGATKWPLPPGGIQPMMDVFERDVLSRTPFIADDDDTVFQFISELMNEFLAIHPFREGNGRTAFILANLVLMQNNLFPLSIYDRRRDQERYYAACEAGRIRQDYAPLADMIRAWADEAIARWEAEHGQ